jgi:cell wall-associated NlpC family hydrolase
VLLRAEVVISSKKRQATALLIGLAAALIAAGPVVADPPTIASKQAEEQQVLNQIQQLDVSLEKAINAYDQANLRLGQINHDLSVNKHDLGVARNNLRKAERTLGARLRAIYIAGDENSTLEVLLGAKNLDDLLNRVDMVNRVSDEDARVLGEIKVFRREVQRRAVELKRAHEEQAKVVADRAAQKAQIEAGLAQRRQLVASIKGAIAKLQAQEAARQAELARQAQARLVAIHQQALEAQNQTVVGATASTPEGVTVAPPSHYTGVVAIAMQYLGTPYVWGGSSPSGFDCSGLVVYVFAQVGVSLPHYTGDLWNQGVPVSADQLQPGDLVFFNGLGHVGIYIGGGQFIHSPHTGDVVKISSLSDPWYSSSYDGARRIL